MLFYCLLDLVLSVCHLLIPILQMLSLTQEAKSLTKGCGKVGKVGQVKTDGQTWKRHPMHQGPLAKARGLEGPGVMGR